MHPRNIYKPDFDVLRKTFPEFAEKLQVDINGKLKLNFMDPESLRVLTKCCLKKDFNLDVEIPPDKLLPTIPLRINYILWIEDLLDHCGIKSSQEVVGIDIGTGACCIYCLLCARMNNWKMYGLEICKESIEYATRNVTNNQLNEQIIIIDQEGSDKIFERLFAKDAAQKTFTICNPPFFASNEEMTIGENRTGKRKFCQTSLKQSSETVFGDGGEFGFVSKIFKESIELRDKIEIYSSMFGCKKNFQKFLALLKQHKIDFTTTELVQGKTCRWAVAYSFSRKLSDFKSVAGKKVEKYNVLKHVIENYTFEDAQKKLLDIFKDLKISIKIINKKEANSLCQYELEATENTWSNQRRKKRAQERNETFEGAASTSENLKMGFEIHMLDESVLIQMFFIEGSMSKDCVNQILQFIKNKFKT